MDLSEYQYWLKSPFYLFFSRKSLAFFYIDYIYVAEIDLIQGGMLFFNSILCCLKIGGKKGRK